jgi:hypothetical protein
MFCWQCWCVSTNFIAPIVKRLWQKLLCSSMDTTSSKER